jgi:ABC-type amino acid transport substrate-binding protein
VEVERLSLGEEVMAQDKVSSRTLSDLITGGRPVRAGGPEQAFDEAAFRKWYAEWATRERMNPDPDAPGQLYDYRAAFSQGVVPPRTSQGEHWPSLNKAAGHPNEIVGGFNTRTGERAPGTVQASEADLVRLGWDAATAKRMSQGQKKVIGYDPNTGLAVYEGETQQQTAAGQPVTPTHPMGEVGKGVVKGVASTAVGLGQLVHKVPGVSAITDWIYGQPSGFSQQSFPAAREMLKPQSTGEKVGFAAEQIGEFMAPGSAVTKLKSAVKTGKGLLDAIIGASLEGASAAGVHTAQQGSTEGAATTGAVASGFAAAAPVVAKGVSRLGQWAANALIKPTAADAKNGFVIQNVFKHKLGGSLEQTFDKASKKIDELGQSLRAELQRYPGADVDVLGALADASVELGKNASRTIGRNAHIEAAIQRILDDPALAQLLKNGRADLVTANQIKQGMGELGAWAYGSRDAEANAMEMVANAFYSKLRAAIEGAIPAGPTRIRQLNQTMGEIIPIKSAVIRRIPIDERQNVINLGDMIGISTGSIGLSLANRLLKSGQAANYMVNTADLAMRGLTPLSQITAGAASQVRK